MYFLQVAKPAAVIRFQYFDNQGYSVKDLNLFLIINSTDYTSEFVGMMVRVLRIAYTKQWRYYTC